MKQKHGPSTRRPIIQKPEARSQKLDSEGKPSGASAPPISVEAAIWRDALPWLKQAYGIAADDKAEEAKLRRRLGRLSKDHGNDQVLLALVAAQREPHLHDPLQWMTAWLRKGRGRHARPQPPICDPANAAEFKALYAEFYDDGGRRPHH